LDSRLKRDYGFISCEINADGGRIDGRDKLERIIEIIIKGKWIIVAVTAVCIAIGIAVNAFVIKPVYVAQTTLMISSIKKSQIKEQVKSRDGDVNNFHP